MKKNHILVAEDDANIRNGLADTLESEGYQVSLAENGDQALEVFRKGAFDLVVLDIMMPGMRSGFLATIACSIITSGSWSKIYCRAFSLVQESRSSPPTSSGS